MCRRREKAETDEETGNEPRFRAWNRDLLDRRKREREMMYSQQIKEKVRKQRWVFVSC